MRIVVRRPMSRMLVAVCVSLMLGMSTAPASAKAPWRVTVKGPGIEGEVDLLRGREPGDMLSFWYPDEFLAGAKALSRTPTGDLGEGYILTWYAALGSETPGKPPTPLVDRIAYYPQINAVELLEVSGAWYMGDLDILAAASGDHDQGGMPRWYRVDSRAAAFLSEELKRIRDQGIVGAAGYVFVAEGTRWPRVRWRAQPLPDPPPALDRLIGLGARHSLWIV